MPVRFHIQTLIISLFLLPLYACSLNSFKMRVASFFIEQSIITLSAEKDLLKAEKQLQENIALLERMLSSDRKNRNLHIYAAQAYYSYAFAFVEDSNINHATSLYYQSYQHASAALALHGITSEDLQGRSYQLRKKTQSLTKQAVNALYWTAVSWAKVIEIKQPDILLFSQLHKTAILMEQVIKLDVSYHFGGPYLFFAVYYGGRPGYLGGNDFLAKIYFDRARKLNKNRLLIVDFLQAKYLNGRVNGEEIFNQRLQSIINAPDDLYPEQALMNAVAKQKASRLLKRSHPGSDII